MAEYLFNFQCNSDWLSISIMHGALLVMFFVALSKSYCASKMENSGKCTHASLSVERGNESMAAIYTSFTIVIAMYSLAIDYSEFAKGHKSALVVMDYLAITYLFFFNSWFRNTIVFPLANKAKKD